MTQFIRNGKWKKIQIQIQHRSAAEYILRASEIFDGIITIA